MLNNVENVLIAILAVAGSLLFMIVLNRLCPREKRHEHNDLIGWQLGTPTGLVSWFATHRDEPLKGFTRAVFSGLTTRALTELIRDVVLPDETLSGLWHVSAAPIDKHSLLSNLAHALGWSIDLAPVAEPVIDRSLDSTRFRDQTGWRPRSWDAMLEELATEAPIS